MRKGFSLIEMLVVIGIIAILTGASVAAFSKLSARAARTHGIELVSNVATALGILLQDKGRWPEVMVNEASGGNGLLKANVAAPLATSRLLSLTSTTRTIDGRTVKVLSGLDRCGIVTPWAQKVIKRASATSSALNLRVPPQNWTVEKHLLHFALDLDGDGITEANVGGETLRIRASAAVWCIGKDGGNPAGQGDPWPYREGLKRGDIYSWGSRQVENE